MITKSWMEFLSPTSSYFPSEKWLGCERTNGEWTPTENKIFENALAEIDSKTPDRWERVAAMLPGKTVRDVISHYHDLEADVTRIEDGLFPCPGYGSSSFMLDYESDAYELKQPYCVGGKRRRYSDQERKKGVPWTEEEHRLFLIGLTKHGKGDWRNISRNFVVSRNPTQVASHAQKYFNRLNSNSKDKRRASIHDITIANLGQNAASPSSMVVDSNQIKEEERVYSRGFMQPNGLTSFGIKVDPKNSYRGALHDSMFGHHMTRI